MIYEYDDIFKSKLPLRYILDINWYYLKKKYIYKNLPKDENYKKRRINLSRHRFRFFVCRFVSRRCLTSRFLHLFLLRPTNVCTYLVIAVIRSFCKMSELRTPGKSRDTARIRVAGRWKFTSARQKRCDCFTGNKDRKNPWKTDCKVEFKFTHGYRIKT